MPDEAPAIVLDGITKTYRLYQSPSEQALAVIGLSWLRFWRKTQYHDRAALEDVSLTIGRGQSPRVIK